MKGNSYWIASFFTAKSFCTKLYIFYLTALTWLHIALISFACFLERPPGLKLGTANSLCMRLMCICDLELFALQHEVSVHSIQCQFLMSKLWCIWPWSEGFGLKYSSYTVILGLLMMFVSRLVTLAGDIEDTESRGQRNWDKQRQISKGLIVIFPTMPLKKLHTAMESQ